MAVLVGVLVKVGVKVIVAVDVGVDVAVTVGVRVIVDVEVAEGTPCRIMCGLSQRALSLLLAPFALTTRINFTVWPARLLKSRSTG